jgi:hypothetical protein
MDKVFLYPRSFPSSIVNFDANWGPRSEMSFSGSPNLVKTHSRKRSATPSVVIVLLQGERITPFVRLWSTTTIIESKPLLRGRSVIKSTESWE